jgi:hypothetical protein
MPFSTLKGQELSTRRRRDFGALGGIRERDLEPVTGFTQYINPHFLISNNKHYQSPEATKVPDKTKIGAFSRFGTPHTLGNVDIKPITELAPGELQRRRTPDLSAAETEPTSLSKLRRITAPRRSSSSDDEDTTSKPSSPRERFDSIVKPPSRSSIEWDFPESEVADLAPKSRVKKAGGPPPPAPPPKAPSSGDRVKYFTSSPERGKFSEDGGTYTVVAESETPKRKGPPKLPVFDTAVIGTLPRVTPPPIDRDPVYDVTPERPIPLVGAPGLPIAARGRAASPPKKKSTPRPKAPPTPTERIRRIVDTTAPETGGLRIRLREERARSPSPPPPRRVTPPVKKKIEIPEFSDRSGVLDLEGRARRDLPSLTQGIEEYKGRIRGIRGRSQKLRRELDETQQRIANLSSGIEHIKSHRANIASMTEQESAMDADLSSTLDNVETLKRRVKRKRSVKVRTLAETASLNEEIQRVRDRNNSLEFSHESYEGSIASRQRELDEIANLKVATDQELESSRAKLSDQTDHAKKLRRTSRTAQQLSDKLDLEDKQLDDEIDTTDRRISDEDRRTADHTKEKQSLEAELEEVNARIRKAKEESARLQSIESDLTKTKAKPKRGGVRFGGGIGVIHPRYFTKQQQAQLQRTARKVLEAEDRDYRSQIVDNDTLRHGDEVTPVPYADFYDGTLHTGSHIIKTPDRVRTVTPTELMKLHNDIATRRLVISQREQEAESKMVEIEGFKASISRTKQRTDRIRSESQQALRKQKSHADASRKIRSQIDMMTGREARRSPAKVDTVQARIEEKRARLSELEREVDNQLLSRIRTLEVALESDVTRYEAERSDLEKKRKALERKIERKRRDTQEALQRLVDEDPYVEHREALDNMLRVVPLARMRATSQVRVHSDLLRRSGFIDPGDYVDFQLSIPRTVLSEDLQLDQDRDRRRRELLVTAVDTGTTAPIKNYLSPAARRVIEEDIETLPMVDLDPMFFEFDFSETIPQLIGTAVANPEERNKYHDYKRTMIGKFVLLQEKVAIANGKPRPTETILKIENGPSKPAFNKTWLSEYKANKIDWSDKEGTRWSDRLVFAQYPILISDRAKQASSLVPDGVVIAGISQPLEIDIYAPFDADRPLIEKAYRDFLEDVSGLNPVNLISSHDRMFVQLAQTNREDLFNRLLHSFDSFGKSKFIPGEMQGVWSERTGRRYHGRYEVIDVGGRSPVIITWPFEQVGDSFKTSPDRQWTSRKEGVTRHESFPILSVEKLNQYLRGLTRKSQGDLKDHLIHLQREYARFIAKEYPQIARDNSLPHISGVTDYLIDVPPHVFKMLNGIHEFNFPTAVRRIIDMKESALDRAMGLMIYLDFNDSNLTPHISRLAADLTLDIKRKTGKADTIMHQIMDEISRTISSRRPRVTPAPIPPIAAPARRVWPAAPPAAPPEPPASPAQPYRVSAYTHAGTETLRRMWNDLDRHINELRVAPRREIDVRDNTAQLIERIEYLQATGGNPNEIKSLQDTVLHSLQNLRRGG